MAIVGQYSDQLTLSGLPTISSTADDTRFVARFSVADGTAIWARSLDGTGPFVDHNAVDISPAGEILIGGRFKETLDVGGGPLQNPNDQYTAAYTAAFDST